MSPRFERIEKFLGVEIRRHMMSPHGGEFSFIVDAQKLEQKLQEAEMHRSLENPSLVLPAIEEPIQIKPSEFLAFVQKQFGVHANREQAAAVTKFLEDCFQKVKTGGQ